MVNQFIQNVFYHFILSDPSLAMKIHPNFFDSNDLRSCFELAKDHITKYHEAPTLDQLKELMHADDNHDVADGTIDVIYASSGAVREYTNEWLWDNVTSWASWRNFCDSAATMSKYIKLHQDNVTVENVKEVMERAKGAFNQHCILEFDDSNNTGSDFWNSISHKRVQLVRSSTGYDFLDMCMGGGTFPGCLICFAGAPKIGKSLWLQNLCAKSVLKGENDCYISLELPEEMIHSRIGSNMFSLPSADYSKYADDQETFKQKMIDFRNSCVVKPGALIVKSFPTSTMSTLDLESYLLAKEDELSTETHKFHFKNIYVDYINIMKNWRNPNTENTYMKIKQIAEDLKAIGLKNGWAIITATQTVRDQYDSTDMSGASIAESSGLGATVDLLFGIIADTIMKANGEYYIKCIYDRVAPKDNLRKKFLLNKNFLRIEEDPMAHVEEVYTNVVGANAFFGSSRKNNKQSVQAQAQVQPSLADAKPTVGATMGPPPPVPTLEDTIPPMDSSTSSLNITSDLFSNSKMRDITKYGM